MNLTFLFGSIGETNPVLGRFGGVSIDGVSHGDVTSGSMRWSRDDPFTPKADFILPDRPTICVVDQQDEPTSARFEAPAGEYDCDTVHWPENLIASDADHGRLVIAMRPVADTPVLLRIPWIELDGQRIHDVVKLTVRCDMQEHDSRMRWNENKNEMEWWTRNGQGNVVRISDGPFWFAEIEFLMIPEIKVVPKGELDALMESTVGA